MSASRIEVRYDGGERFIVRAGVHNLYVDQPVAEGGEDWGPTPTELFVASIAACAAFYASKYVRRHGYAADAVRVEATFAMSEMGTSRVAHVGLRLTPPAGMTAEEREALARVVERCTVRNSLRQPPQFDVEITGTPVERRDAG